MPLIERIQILVYLSAIMAAVTLGVVRPELGGTRGVAVWPVLGLLLYVTFVQTPLRHLRDSFRDVRFLAAAVVGNFVLLPLIVWALLHLTPQDPAVRLGVLLVLLVPRALEEIDDAVPQLAVRDQLQVPVEMRSR